MLGPEGRDWIVRAHLAGVRLVDLRVHVESVHRATLRRNEWVVEAVLVMMSLPLAVCDCLWLILSCIGAYRYLVQPQPWPDPFFSYVPFHCLKLAKAIKTEAKNQEKIWRLMSGKLQAEENTNASATVDSSIDLHPIEYLTEQGMMEQGPR
ncbi:hypothetical protein RIF29_29681 [Crotalaria pallida]|uniref:Uncharacterized protein n=1 Tax=Crotalaria pallida TaxID=3830 RepID=A0AAN9EF80_CROPI